MNRLVIVAFIVVLGPCLQSAVADCSACPGDVAIVVGEDRFWGYPSAPDRSVQTHSFSPKCDATNLGGMSGEVYLTIRVWADLAGSTQYVTANLISGTQSTAITSEKGFINAPKNGQFFVKSGVTDCSGEMNQHTVRLDYDDFNAFIAAGNGSIAIEVHASPEVKELCSTCGCAPGDDPLSRVEVILIYLDCNIIGSDCSADTVCDDALICNGVETCEDGVCISPGNPCIITNQVCTKSGGCRDCLNDGECQKTDGQYCNGEEKCNLVTGKCEAGSPPCTAIQTCDDSANVCADPMRTIDYP